MVKRRGEVWYARLTTRDASGKQVQKWISLPGAKNERQAKREEERLKTELHEGRFIEPSRDTVGQYLNEWLEGARPRLSARVFVTYQGHVRDHLIPELGGIPLVKLTAANIRTAYAHFLKSGRKDGRGGLKPATVKYIHVILKQALKQAVIDHRLLRNPADGVKPPRAAEPEMMILDEKQTMALIEAAKAPLRKIEMHVPVLLAACTAMRKGEILGLRWKDVDLDAGTLTVNQTLEYIGRQGPSGPGIRFKEPKTKSSRRTIALTPMAVEALRRHRAAQFERRQEQGDAYKDHGLVVSKPDGTPIAPGSFNTAFNSIVRRSGLPPINFHALRHGHISHLIAQKAPMKAISLRAGHSGIQITMNQYGHLIPGVEAEMIERFDASLRAAQDGS
jgi:integrase